ncbi:MAG: 16S rRNA (adenine(1518)-N(6)/adenine(1519)-N(6))-dimethyltransferase RsmA [Coriobacteriia bacterium]|nr:16S rRNA (adenine(1518)-N(6)/adenine(1519)-N(6))-dimethyltransferase RsmA [Coriobacteriia bacterium]
MAHSRLATPGATIAVLRAHDIQTRKSLGQHFLVDDNVVGRILALADLRGDEPVLEIGPGIGTLTVALCEAAGTVVAVERDERLLEILADTTAGCDRLSVVHADAVSVSPTELVTPLGPPAALVANLPYAVAATVVLRFFEVLPSLRFAVVMVQSEVADRMSASPGCKAYGAYTVKLNLHACSAGRFNVSPGCFLPPPRVESAVLRLERIGVPAPSEYVEAAACMADAAFAQRRKTLRNSIRFTLGVPSDVIDAVLSSAGLDGGRRAEMLTIPEFLRLGEAALRYGLLP